MKKIVWNLDKAQVLLNNTTRGNVTFEDCVVALDTGKLLDVVPNPSSNHSDQKMYILNIRNYAYCVPFVETKDEIFLKTIFPNRDFTALYLRDQDHDENEKN
jgi:hypothetical protein